MTAALIAIWFAVGVTYGVAASFIHRTRAVGLTNAPMISTCSTETV